MRLTVTNDHRLTNIAMQSSEQAQAFEDELKTLWLGAMGGDHAAYEQALGLIAGRLRGYFARRLQAMPAEIEDLVQETLMAVHLKRATFDPAYPVSAWVLSIGKYKLVDFWRRHERTGQWHLDIEALDQSDPQALIEDAPQEGTAHDLAKLLQTLPDGQRTSIELTKLHGMTAVEAAKQTGMSVSAIKVNVHRGIKRLSDLIKSGSSS
jgi:RNA polymerase sigma-70 factor (ECF subfamily)